MLRRLIVYYWRESCNIRTVAFLLVVILLTLFSQSIVWYDDEGEAKLYEPLSVSLVDHDQSVISYVIRTQLEDLEAVGQVHTESMEQAQQRLKNNEILLIIEMPEGFYEQTISGQERTHVRVWLNEQMPAESNLFARLLNHAVDSITSVQATLFTYQEELRPVVTDEELYQEYSYAATLDVAFRLIKRNSMLIIEEEARMRQFWYVAASLISLFAMLPALLVLMLAQQEIRSGQHSRLKAANVSWWQLTLAKVLIGLVWLMTGLVPMLVAAQRFLPQLGWWKIVVAVIPLYISVSCICLALAYRSRQTEAAMLTAWMLLLVFLLLAGGIYPRQLLPGFLVRIQFISPAYWSFSQLYEAMYERELAAGFYIWPLVTIAVAAAVSWLSMRRSKV
jgi:ABC-type multidrug transport system permease subunit